MIFFQCLIVCNGHNYYVQESFNGVNIIEKNSVESTGWLVGCFWLKGPLRQYFSLYRAISQREGERKRNDREKKCPNNPHPHLLQAQ